MMCLLPISSDVFFCQIFSDHHGYYFIYSLVCCLATFRLGNVTVCINASNEFPLCPSTANIVKLSDCRLNFHSKLPGDIAWYQFW